MSHPTARFSGEPRLLVQQRLLEIVHHARKLHAVNKVIAHQPSAGRHASKGAYNHRIQQLLRLPQTSQYSTWRMLQPIPHFRKLLRARNSPAPSVNQGILNPNTLRAAKFSGNLNLLLQHACACILGVRDGRRTAPRCLGKRHPLCQDVATSGSATMSAKQANANAHVQLLGGLASAVR